MPYSNIGELLLENDTVLKETIMAIQNELIRRKAEKEKNERKYRFIIRTYFQDDIRKLSFITESGFLKYQDCNDYILKLAKKDLKALKLKFYDEND